MCRAILAAVAGAAVLLGVQSGALALPFPCVQLTNDTLNDTNPEVNIRGDVTWEKDTDILLWWNQYSQLNRL